MASADLAAMDHVRVIDRPDRDRLGEGPMWSPRENAVFWVDILGQKLNRFSLADNSVLRFDIPDVIGWVIERRSGGFVAGIGRGVSTLSVDPLVVTPFVDLESDKPSNRMNDAVADNTGRLWAGTMPFSCDVPTGSLYRILSDGSVATMDSGYHVANGPAIDPEGRFLFHTNTVLGHVYRFALHDDGSLGARELFLEFDERWGCPDGMTFDAEGGLWIAHWGGSRVSRFGENATLDRAIHLPASQITSMCFAGPNLDRMFVTSAFDGLDDEPLAGCLFEVDPKVSGLPPASFAG